MKEAVVIYESEQVDAVARYASAREGGAQIVAIDYWAERELKKRGATRILPFTDFRQTPEEADELLESVQTLAHEWYRSPSMDFFEHRGIKLGEALELALGDYLQKAMYYVAAFERFAEKYPDVKTLAVPISAKVAPATAGPFAQFEFDAPYEAAVYIGRKRGILIRTLGDRRTMSRSPFPPRSLRISLILGVYNFFITLLVPRKPLKLLASNFWYHIAPFIERMGEVELVLMDRKELRHIPLRELLRHRVRFMHPQDEKRGTLAAAAAQKQGAFAHEWERAKISVSAMPQFNYRGATWWPLAEQAFDYMVTVYAERVVFDADALVEILRREKIDEVVLRAGISAQHHFFLLGQLSRLLGLPAIEIQHGILVAHPRFVHSRLGAEYFAAYGNQVREALVRGHGYNPKRVPIVGSARFDRYIPQRAALTTAVRDMRRRELGLDSARPVILFAMTEEVIELTPFAFDSYELRDYFRELREILDALPAAQAIIKFRSKKVADRYEDYIIETLPAGRFVISYSDAFSMILLADIVCSPFSTMIYEGLLGKKPVVLYPVKKTDTYCRSEYEKGALPVSSPDELVKSIGTLIEDEGAYAAAVQKGQHFLENNYSFDGQASERLADILRKNLPAEAA